MQGTYRTVIHVGVLDEVSPDTYEGLCDLSRPVFKSTRIW
jgi:hypothetical protein